jgi:hypothetical protein
MKYQTLLMMIAGTVVVQLGCGGGDGGTIATCGTFSPCGGDITGTWTIDGLCIEGDVASLMGQSSDMPAECKDAIKSLTMKASGTLTYANGVETSNVTMNMAGHYVYSAACISAMAGGTTVPVTQAVCDAASSSTGADGPQIACKLAGGGCDCTMSMTDTTNETADYTVSGSTLSYTDGSDGAEFCVSGKALTVRPLTDVGEPGIQMKLHRN